MGHRCQPRALRRFVLLGAGAARTVDLAVLDEAYMIG